MNVQQFLVRYRLAPGDIDTEALTAEFRGEMERGLVGSETSLAMIPTYVSADRDIPVDEPVIVIDAGGTNLRVACVSFGADRRARIDDYASFPMPGSREAVSAAGFFHQLAEYLQPILDKSDRK